MVLWLIALSWPQLAGYSTNISASLQGLLSDNTAGGLQWTS